MTRFETSTHFPPFSLGKRHETQTTPFAPTTCVGSRGKISLPKHQQREALPWRLSAFILHPSALIPPLPALPSFPQGKSHGNSRKQIAATTYRENRGHSTPSKNQKREALPTGIRQLATAD